MPTIPPRTRFSAIVAAGPTGVIGKDGDMPWRLSADLQRFKKLTMGTAMVMGRKTFQSIGKPLPGRRNLVMSASPSFAAEGVDVVQSLEELFAATAHDEKVYVIGGAAIYDLLLPECDEILLTRVYTQTSGDTFVTLNLQDFKHTLTERIPQTAKNSMPTEFQVWKRGV